jgi:hypothetical protein
MDPVDLKQKYFGKWFLQRCAERKSVFSVIVETEVLSFNRAGIFNSHNSRVWTKVNSRSQPRQADKSFHCGMF